MGVESARTPPEAGRLWVRTCHFGESAERDYGGDLVHLESVHATCRTRGYYAKFITTQVTAE